MEFLTGNPSIDEALAASYRDQYIAVMKLQMQAHKINGTWRLIDRSEGSCNISWSIWALRAKLDEKGS